MPLRVDYDLSRVRLPLAELPAGRRSLWRYREVLPLAAGRAVSLGEGWTPLLARRAHVWVKDEAQNPTGSFKARGMAVAVSMARALGARALTAPSAGNAAGALAAYGAAAGLPGRRRDARRHAARVRRRVPRTTAPRSSSCAGTIADAGKLAARARARGRLRRLHAAEPYRVEGKKTMAYELVEQLDGELPDVDRLSDRRRHRPRRHVEGVRRDARARLDRAGASAAPRLGAGRRLRAGGARRSSRAPKRTEPLADPQHARVRACACPSPIGGFLCLRALRETGGTAIAVDAKRRSRRDARAGGGAPASTSAPRAAPRGRRSTRCARAGWIATEDERVVVFNTGTGLKYR